MRSLALQPADIRGIANRSAGIRAFLRENGPSTAKEVCLGLGITDSYTGSVVRASLRSMTLDGILARHNDHSPCRFSVVREPAPRATTSAAERRADTFRAKSASAYKNTEAAYQAWQEATANEPLSICERIRAAVKQRGIATADDIYAFLGIAPTVGRVRLYSLIHGLVRDGMLGRINGKPFRYEWLRDADQASRQKRPPTAKSEARREDREVRRAAREQARIARERARATRLLQHKAEAEARRQERQSLAMERATNCAKKAAPHIAALAAAAEERTPNRPKAPASPAVVPETIAQWMARTGKQPQVLPHSFDSPRTKFPGRRPTMNTKGHAV